MFGDVMAQIEAFPQWLQWWLRWMQVMLILLPIFFIRYREAQLILVAQLLNFAAGAGVLLWEGGQITKLFGLGHIFWAVAFFLILWRLWNLAIDFSGRPLYRAWLYGAMITLSISLPLDAYDLLQYANGLRMPMTEYYAQP